MLGYTRYFIIGDSRITAALNSHVFVTMTKSDKMLVVFSVNTYLGNDSVLVLTSCTFVTSTGYILFFFVLYGEISLRLHASDITDHMSVHII